MSRSVVIISKSNLRGCVRNQTCRVKTCCAKFSTEYNRRKHARQQHQPEKKPRSFLCPDPDCASKPEVRFGSLLELRAHEQVMHQQVDRPPPPPPPPPPAQEVCNYNGCGRAFRKPSQLKAHLRTHTGSRPFACEYPGCMWAFRTASKLRRHERSHRGDAARRYACDLCGRAFTRQEHLRAHALTHSPSKRFLCAYADCGARFSQKSGLYVHLRQKHGDGGGARASSAVPAVPAAAAIISSPALPTGPGKFRCPVEGCAKGVLFHSRADLTQHVSNFHKAVHGVAKNPNSLLLLSQPAAGKEILAMLQN